MRKIKIYFMISVGIIAISCKKDKMENRTKFSYGVSVTAPEDYPVEVHMAIYQQIKNL